MHLSLALDPQCPVTLQKCEAAVVEVATRLAESEQEEEESWTPHLEMAVTGPARGPDFICPGGVLVPSHL